MSEIENIMEWVTFWFLILAMPPEGAFQWPLSKKNDVQIFFQWFLHHNYQVSLRVAQF